MQKFIVLATFINSLNGKLNFKGGTGRLFRITKIFYAFGLQLKLATISAKPLQPQCNQRHEHYPKTSGKFPL